MHIKQSVSMKNHPKAYADNMLILLDLSRNISRREKQEKDI
jgi:hypothetical protein